MYKVEPKSDNIIPMFGLESKSDRIEFLTNGREVRIPLQSEYTGDLELFSITALSIKAEEAVKAGDMAEFRRIERFMRAKGWIR